MSTFYDSRFKPGQRVRCGDIEATVERVIFARGMTDALVLIEWWHNGDLRSREVHEDDLAPL